jgi:hypothetical protein
VPFQRRKGEEKLLEMAGYAIAPRLAVYMGDRYAEFVSFCLNIDEKQGVPSAVLVQEAWLKLDEIRSAIVVVVCKDCKA